MVKMRRFFYAILLMGATAAVSTEPIRLYFGRLSKVEYVEKLEGKTVVMKGYMLPMTDVRPSKTFILMQYKLNDEHDPLPPARKLVFVTAPKEIISTQKRLRVTGTFHRRVKLDPLLGKTFFAIEAQKVEELY